ncbi:MAG: SDR family oxidoreductase [Clostridia bacterium]|nr:SDR family oxidoreductase [Clostridia bacterium]
MFDLTGKRALVTGATQGIGLAIAQILGKQGATVYVNGASSLQKCEEAAAKVEGGIPAHGDLLDPKGADALFEQVGAVDILVLNASVQFQTKWENIEGEELEKQLQLNFKSSLRLMQLYVPYMKEQKWGRIVTVGSVQQYKPHPDMAVYAATKAGQMSLVQNLAAQLAPFGITVNNMAPGVIDTPRNAAALSDPDYAPKVYAKIPAGYAGTAEDCAAGVLLLCSEEGRYITGIDLIIDGGMHL